ncbi:MAG: biosynthetic-type acetolactate synthase large subunit [Desulfarculaceae bacterium]|jgi:acetolactate synthase-1/2/3 large subunit
MTSQNTALNKPESLSPSTGADAVIASLKQQETDLIFGMVGGQIMPVYDALYRDGCIKHITVGHEQGAAHMADGFARATGRVGVVMTTSGPGATNLVTGLATAMMDSMPMLAFTGQVGSSFLGKDAFQEADMWGITMPVTKHNYQVASAGELPHVIAEAFYLALSGRPGPVLIDLPRDVIANQCQNLLAVPQWPEGYQSPYEGNNLQILKALDILRASKRPVILAGGGIISAGACSELLALAELLDIPVSSTLMGLGNFPRDHRLSLGMPGMHGGGAANLAIHNSDVLLCVGTRLDDRITGLLEGFAPNAQLIHIDIDSSELDKILPCAVAIEGDAKPVLQSLYKGASAWEKRPDVESWLTRISDWQRRFPMGYREKDGIVAPQRVVQELSGLMSDDDLVVTGVGQHQMYVAQYYPFKKPRTFISSGGLGTMGFGLPASLGAKLGKPEKNVVCIDGDGSFLMNIQELATAVRYRIPVVEVILKNTYLGMVRQWQDLFYDKRLSQVQLETPPYHKVAESFGCRSRQVTRPEQVKPGLEWALATSRREKLPVVLEVIVDPDAMVLPMVPPGKKNAEFIPCDVEVK